MQLTFFEHPILNSPYVYPGRHWELDADGQPTNRLIESRRRSDLITPVPKAKKRKAPKGPTVQVELELTADDEGLSTAEQKYDPTPIINELRGYVDTWRALPNPQQWQVTPETARLLQHWRHHQFQGVRPFFCQIEAVETAIWLTEVAPKLGGSGKKFREHLAGANAMSNPDLFRIALKLATGAGKTTVMAMLIALGFTPAATLAFVMAAGFIADTASLLHAAAAADKAMLFEGAQGVMLDVDYGTYPYVTSSNTGVGGVITGSGLSHKQLGEIIGVVKAYTTRVGGGPFPVELPDGTDAAGKLAKGEEIRQRGGEFGATTGRPRRCGWLDLVAVKFACRLNGVDSIALTKLDILDPEPELPVCIAYELDGVQIDTVPARLTDLARVKPIYQVLPGWKSSTSGVQHWSDLPPAAQSYVAFIERTTGVPVKWIGTGPGREATVVRKAAARA